MFFYKVLERIAEAYIKCETKRDIQLASYIMIDIISQTRSEAIEYLEDDSEYHERENLRIQLREKMKKGNNDQ